MKKINQVKKELIAALKEDPMLKAKTLARIINVPPITIIFLAEEINHKFYEH